MRPSTLAMPVRSLAAVIALTVGVSATTFATSALADETPPPPPTSTPLNVRPSRPLDLAPAPSQGSRSGTALAAIVVVLGSAAWLWKRKRPAKAAGRTPTLLITARQTIGVRSELLVVEVGGQTLLLGVTPGAIQCLSVLPDAADKLALADPAVEEAVAQAPAPVQAPRPLPPRRAEGGAFLEEQVRGLLRARRSS